MKIGFSDSTLIRIYLNNLINIINILRNFTTFKAIIKSALANERKLGIAVA